MSQDKILALLSEQPMTQKAIRDQLHIEAGVLSHRLKALMVKGLVERSTLEIKGRPFGYVKVNGTRQVEPIKWPKFVNRNEIGWTLPED